MLKLNSVLSLAYRACLYCVNMAAVLQQPWRNQDSPGSYIHSSAELQQA
jgi:hypothetical protein